MVQERAEYRLRYPLLAQPLLRLEAEPQALQARVIDLSESGLLLEFSDAPAFAPGAVLRGRMRLMQGRDVEFSARCLRLVEREAALAFEPDSRMPIPVIFEEQRAVRSRFPEWR